MLITANYKILLGVMPVSLVACDNQSGNTSACSSDRIDDSLLNVNLRLAFQMLTLLKITKPQYVQGQAQQTNKVRLTLGKGAFFVARTAQLFSI